MDDAPGVVDLFGNRQGLLGRSDGADTFQGVLIGAAQAGERHVQLLRKVNVPANGYAFLQDCFRLWILAQSDTDLAHVIECTGEGTSIVKPAGDLNTLLT